MPTGASDPIQPLSELAGTLAGFRRSGPRWRPAPRTPAARMRIFRVFATRRGRLTTPGDAELELASLPTRPDARYVEAPEAAKPPRFGTVQKSLRACAVAVWASRWPLGPKKAPRSFRLYDSNPESIAVRDFYLAGFRDGCIRHLRASIVFFGAPSTHETVRYDPMNRDIAQSPTDQAYEEIKRRICGVPRGKPCGPQRIARLEATTVFVTAYDDFGSSTRWAEFLLNNGKLAGVSLKSR